MAAVTLIANPPYVLDFQNFARAAESPLGLRERVEGSVKSLFEVGRIAVQAAGSALTTNARYSWSTFKYIVLRYDGERYRLPETQAALVTRSGIWLVAHTIGFLFCSIVTFLQEYRSLPSYLLSFAPNDLNLSHLTARKTHIDVSHVPDTIQVSTLLSLYDEINFTNREAPGYMPEVTRQETTDGHTVTFSVRTLRDHLKTFIKNTNERNAITGTPPHFLAAELMKFYKKIEDATRFCTDKVIKEHDDFMRARGNVAPIKGEKEYQKYQDLLCQKARLVITFAMAGAHCGGRYMGDAIETYLDMQDGNSSMELQTVQGRLWTLLGKKRKNIAKAHIATHLGHDTHQFSAYMANMGGVLGLPGTEDIVEYLTGSLFNRQKFLRLFFETYTPAFIREAVQAKIKKSQELRGAIFDWLKDRVGNWKSAEYKAHTAQVVKEAKAATDSTRTGFVPEIEKFTALVVELEKHAAWSATFEGTERPYFPDMEEKWDEFFDSIFGCPAAKAYLQEQFKSAGSPLEVRRARQQFKTALSKPQFQAGLKEIVLATRQAKTANLENLKRVAALYDKVEAVNASLIKAELPTMTEEVLLRNLQSGSKLEAVVSEHVERLRRSEFLDQLIRTREDDENPAKTVEERGLKKPLLDWILYTSNILTPQNLMG